MKNLHWKKIQIQKNVFESSETNIKTLLFFFRFFISEKCKVPTWFLCSSLQTCSFGFLKNFHSSNMVPM